MLRSLQLENFTVFPAAELKFGKNLNVIIGENGSGKTHILKAAYAAIAVSAARGKDASTETPSKAQMQAALAQKLLGVFRPDSLGRLVRRARGRRKCRLSYRFDRHGQNLAFTFSTVAKTEVTVETMPTARERNLPVYLPTRELLTFAPGFVALYERTHLSFEETWRDTCILLESPLARGPREKTIKRLLEPLERAMGGKVEVDRGGRFYLNVSSGNMEMHLVAEGLRKLATIARLIATGSLLDKGYLFWDEPEANLNPRIIKTLARTILEVARSGVQVFIGTHSLFLLRELHILQVREFADFDTRCFGLHFEADGSVSVQQGKTMDDVGDIASLDEDLEQSDRYINTEMGLEREGGVDSEEREGGH